MTRNMVFVIGTVLMLSGADVAHGELLGYWSADSTGGTGTVLPNDQGNDALDGELIDMDYTADGQGHTGQPGDYALDFPGEDIPYVEIPPTEATFETATITAWVNGVQTGDYTGVVHTRDSSQPIGIGYRAGTGQLQYHWNNNASSTWGFASDLVIPENEWAFIAVTVEEDLATLYLGGDGGLETAVNEIFHDPQDNFTEWRLGEDNCCGTERNFLGLLDDVSIWDHALTEEEITSLFDGTQTPLTLAGIGIPAMALQAGDADQDLDFDQLDLVKVQIAAKYLTGQAATWGEGDWDGAPGGEPGNPPVGNGFFDQLDIIDALGADKYLKGPYAAIGSGGTRNDDQTSVVYDRSTGELSVDAPAGKELTSINITSAGSRFIGQKPAALDGAFDNFAGDNLFKATFGGSFGSISFGAVLDAGIPQETLAGDLTVVGSLAGGGDLGAVDLIYVPEPNTLWLLAAAAIPVLGRRRRRMMQMA